VYERREEEKRYVGRVENRLKATGRIMGGGGRATWRREREKKIQVVKRRKGRDWKERRSEEYLETL
jgi:hypothetical protein